MSWALTTNFNLPGGSKFIFGKFDFDEDAGTLTYPVELRTSGATDCLVFRTTMVIRDGISTTLARQPTPPVGLNIEDIQRYLILGTRSTPTGFTDAFTAMRAAGNTKVLRRLANEAHQFSAGHIDNVSLAGVGS